MECGDVGVVWRWGAMCGAKCGAGGAKCSAMVPRSTSGLGGSWLLVLRCEFGDEARGSAPKDQNFTYLLLLRDSTPNFTPQSSLLGCHPILLLLELIICKNTPYKYQLII
ncbi:hypothetical protein Syun_025920 [Stephania yunnanensis]|uniref:Uncharacterized protein n=1 Tax=Stephania yunnanensis TaxID=152371 RepID=A0AAP0ESJ9_9MAGN